MIMFNEGNALHACAKAMNTLSTDPLRDILSQDFHYASQHVFEELESGHAFLEYIEAKFEAIARSGAKVFAEIGGVEVFGEHRPCVILAQNHLDNLVGIVLAKVEMGKLVRLDLCAVPSPYTAERSGEYPH